MNSRDNMGETINVGPLSGEIKLDLSQVPVDPVVASAEIAECATHLQLNGGTIQTELANVSLTALNDFHSRAMLMRKDQPDYITGMKCYYAVLDNKLTLIYKPLFMTLQSTSGATGTFAVSEGDFYSYNTQSSSFDKMELSQTEELLENYTENILICHQTGQQCSPFVPGVDPDAAIFPLQTIYALLTDNEANTLVIHSSMRNEPNNTFKECLLLSSKTVAGIGSGIFKGKFANRCHLCPPSCNTLTYSLVKV